MIRADALDIAILPNSGLAGPLLWVGAMGAG